MFFAASLTVCSIRFFLVSGLFATAIHSSAYRRTDGGNALKFCSALLFRLKRFTRSSGIVSVWACSKAFHVPDLIAKFDHGCTTRVHQPSVSHPLNAFFVGFTPPAVWLPGTKILIPAFLIALVDYAVNPSETKRFLYSIVVGNTFRRTRLAVEYHPNCFVLSMIFSKP